jgi:F-type H+-transporting ATPase subunit b
MNRLINVLVAAEDPTVSHHWLYPEIGEIIYGGLAAVIVIGGLVKFAGPMVVKSFRGRTERIQKELDDAANAKVAADADAKGIRAALGDIASERSRILADADTQAAAVLSEGRARIAAEVADLEAKADSDLAAARGRNTDELRAEIAMLAARATPIVVQRTLNEQTKAELVESFIQSVGASR